MTNRQLLETLADSNTSTQDQEFGFEAILKRAGFPQAKVTCGIVYLVGYGTSEYPPSPINMIARYFLDIVNKNYVKTT